jgi:hypothetical protein
MTEYSCSNCNFVSDRKQNVERHINRTDKCWDTKIPEIIKNVDEVECKYCKKILTTIGGLRFHQKNNCEMKKIIDRNNEELNKLSSVSIINDNSTTNNINTNNINNINNINTTNNIAINNNIVVLLPYNDPRMYDEEIIKYCIQRKFESVPNMISSIHMNEKKPENHNIHITNRRTDDANVYTKNGWEFMSKSDLFVELIDKYQEQMEYYAEKNPEYSKFIDVYKEIKERDFTTDGEYDDQKFIKNMSDKINNMFITKQELIKGTRARHKKSLRV